MEKITALAFFDLDGTLLDGHSQITPEITAAMQALRKNNVLPLIATGRSLGEIDDILAKSTIDSAILLNGQYIQVAGEKAYESTFSQEECQALFEHTQNLGHELSFYNDRDIWCTGYNEALHQAYAYIHSHPPKIQPDFSERSVNMMLVLGTGHDSTYHAKFPQMTFYRNTPFSIDVVQKGVSKGTGVQKLTELLNLGHLDTYAFGDGANDLALFDACKYTIAMGNAKPELKEKATFITKANTDGGIVHGLKHYGLI